MKKLIKHPSLWLCCALLFLPLMIASPSMAQCEMTSVQLDAAAASCTGGDLDCFVSLAKSNVDCAANIAWMYMILYAPENPDAVLNAFMSGLPGDYTAALTAAINAAYQANQNEQNAGSRTSANEYPYGK
jgi:hypothetical protein